MSHLLCILLVYSWDPVTMSSPKCFSNAKRESFWASCWHDGAINHFLPSWWPVRNVRSRSLIDLNSFTLHPLLLELGTAGLQLCSSSNLGNCKKANFTQTQAFQTSLITWDFLCCAFKLYVLYKKHTGDNFFHIFLVWLWSVLPRLQLWEHKYSQCHSKREGEMAPAFLF